jgi:hypothetical protein
MKRFMNLAQCISDLPFNENSCHLAQAIATRTVLLKPKVPSPPVGYLESRSGLEAGSYVLRYFLIGNPYWPSNPHLSLGAVPIARRCGRVACSCYPDVGLCAYSLLSPETSITKVSTKLSC